MATLTSLRTDWDRLACFGDRSLALEGTYGNGCGACGGTFAGEFDPRWLAYTFPGTFPLWPDYPPSFAGLDLHVAPGSGIELPALGSIVRVTGHFSDPASVNCTITWDDGVQVMPADPMTAELYCREQFVVSALEVLGIDPDFP